MSRFCDVCGKGPQVGHRVVRRGTPKKDGGRGVHIVKRMKRTQLPNLQTVRVTIGGHTRKTRMCTKCLKAGRFRSRLRS